ncbi:MAG: AAA family ATPase [Paludibacter sp.]|nr:AAA family ATPase [Paludibacter sp.]MDD4429150.1 AAA family ATPase [Paludibacter sp.]
MAIKKFSKIDNLAVFSGYTWDISVPAFEKINIIYGRNYSGKTTLSRILRAIETQRLPEKYENPSFELALDDGSTVSSSTISSCGLDVRVFNEDFVKANLRFLIDPDSEIEPFAILGSDNAKTQKEIDDLTDEIGSDTEGSETGLHKQHMDKKNAANTATSEYKSANSALESKLSAKATDRRTGIKYNSTRFGNQNYNIANMRNDIATVTSSNYVVLTSEQKTEYEKTINEQPKATIPEITAPKLNIEDFCRRATALLSRKIGASEKIADLLHNAALNDWVRRGKELLEEQDVCAFCGSPISLERWAEINAHFDEESKKLETEIDALVSAISNEIQQLERAFSIDKTTYYSKYHAKVDEFLAARMQAITDYCTFLKLIVEQLNQRKDQITVDIAFDKPDDNSTTITSLYYDFRIIVKESNDYTANLAMAKQKAQHALRLQEVYDFCITIGYTAEFDNIERLKTASEIAKQEASKSKELLEQKIQERQEKLRQLNDEEEGARRVNAYLNDYFGHNFVSLEAESIIEGEKRIRFRIMRNGKPAYNLSEGECSLIAFCYFMAKLNDVNTLTKKPIIWIDDPISSLDGNHVFFIYSLLRAKIVEADQYEQLFVSTHNLDFLKYLKRLTGKANEKKMKHYIVQRIDETSTISQMPSYLQKYVTEFNYLFHEIYKCSEITMVDDTNYTSFYNFGNNARKFLEILMFYYYPDDTNQINKLERFFGAGRVPAVFTDRINNEYSHLCGVFERGEIPTEVPEMLTAAKFIIDTLKRKNPDQYSSLMLSVGATAPAT